MKVPTMGSKVVVNMRYRQGSAMIPVQSVIEKFEGTVLLPFKWLNDRQFCMSGDKNIPVRVMSMDIIDSIEMISGALKSVDTDTKFWIVNGSKGSKYTVSRNSTHWNCTCTGFTFRKTCKHVSELSGVI
jgi:hypothetical protein